ncbi:thiol:disulfide interchange protein DsbA/DsbL [Undibacterium terreum]|uniref:Thiol:disulfide interchange protein n=1 Tax=Undibacterium terreum TaxID=1224302 RepID=A0A916U9V2_9BURK|nr:thiol:disulfide interchange protein DsbA/DsbL [Undibacterium terreum]GGC63942.1 thiol:disulfide interchange protein [Undibacterium terreum]
MRIFSIAITALALAASTAFASPASPKDGADYQTLKSPQSSQTVGKKIEVIEFFMYHCPACNELEPALQEWVKKQGDNIVFRRIHVPHTGPADPEAHLFLTLQAMKNEDALHDKIERTWHVEHQRLLTDADNINWAAKNGLDKAKFTEVYNSFAVTTQLRNLARVVAGYQVDSTPTLVVDGRYLTNPAMVDEANPGTPRPTLYKATLQVVDALIAKAKAAH